MPANIVGAMIDRMQTELGYTVWDGEVPKNAEDGTPIRLPESFPVITLEMPGEGFERTWTTENPYGDQGNTFIEVYGTKRADVMTILDAIEALFARNWEAISFGAVNPNYYEVFQCLLLRWSCIRLPDVRTPTSNYIYRGYLVYDVAVHGVIETR